jgi:hypothetical protein
VIIASAPLFFFFLSFILFCPFLVGHGIQINEYCIQSENDLTVHHALSSSEKRNECGSLSRRGRNRSSTNGS